jgi:hypothetical protein
MQEMLRVQRAGAVVFAVAAIGVGCAWAQTDPAQTGLTSDAVLKRLDPTDFRTRAEIRNEYQSLQGGGSRNVVVPRVDYALTRVFSVRLETPYVRYDPDRPGRAVDSGFGDFLIRPAWRAVRGEGYAVVAACEFIFDTADDPTLGFGRNVAGPLVFAAVDLPKLSSTFFPNLQHYFSHGNGGSGNDVSYSVVKANLLTRWPNRYYTFLEPVVIVDYERNHQTGMTVELELGKLLTPNAGVWVRPGVGVFGNDLPQVYNWNLEMGLRYIF